ncbi:MAG: ATPase component of transporter with duplicated ATPase domain [Fibrobacteres bacterium]|nr:ATPase component of transporter with duplicated ATPase domain [Fibrobacterota bacterium]
MIDVRNLSLSFGDRYLFKELSFQLGDKEKICLAGPNGSGKTTLLKVLCGEQQTDGGQIIRSNSVKIGYLRQHLGEDKGATVYEAALQAFGDALDFAKELDGLHAILGEREATEAELNRMDFLQDELIRSNYYTAESETRTVLAGLGFSNDEQDRPLGAMSGGWRMRVALAKVLLAQPTTLFLDEPTNHLDLESIVWLESYIRDYSGSLVLISHDRAFVDRTCDRILEITNSQLTYYPVPYTRYEEEKALRMEQLVKAHKKQTDEIASLERFVERFKAKASKATQAQSKQKQIDKIERIVIPGGVSTIRLKFPEAPPSGQWVFDAEDVDKAYGDQEIFRDGKFSIQRGDHAVLVGPNGAGKTTLLKVLQGIEKPTGGKVTVGANVVIGYFAQYEEPTAAEAAMDLITYLEYSLPKIPTQQLRSVLGAMLFSDDDAFKKFGILSGGERARVRMCRLLLQNCNVLILDEPTNHLDMDSKQLLMRAIEAFTGTVLFVSHDRYFVENIATRVILVKNGKVTDYPGDYHYYLNKLLSDDRYATEAKQAGGKTAKSGSAKSESKPAGLSKLSNANVAQSIASATATAAVPSAAKAAPAAVNGSASLDYEAKKEAEKQKRKAEKRWGEIESAISGLDQKVSTLDAELCLPDTYADQALSTRLAREKREAEDALGALYKELEQLEAEGYGG